MLQPLLATDTSKIGSSNAFTPKMIYTMDGPCFPNTMMAVRFPRSFTPAWTSMEILSESRGNHSLTYLDWFRWPFQFSTLLSGVFAVSGAVSLVKLRSESVGTGQAHPHALFKREQHRLCSAVLARRLARFLFLVRRLLCTALRPSNQRKCLVHYSGVSVLTFHP